MVALAQALVQLLHVAARRSCVKNGTPVPGPVSSANTIQTALAALLKFRKFGYQLSMPEQLFRVDSLLALLWVRWSSSSIRVGNASHVTIIVV